MQAKDAAGQGEGMAKQAADQGAAAAKGAVGDAKGAATQAAGQVGWLRLVTCHRLGSAGRQCVRSCMVCDGENV